MARYGISRKQAWILLCALQGLLGVTAVHTTQNNNTVTLLALIVWWGAGLSIEAVTHDLKGKPSGLAVLSGALMLAFCCWRSYATYHLDSTIYALFSLQGVGLALVGWPLARMWRKAVQPVLILSLFGAQLIVQRMIPMAPVTNTTAKAVELFLSLFDYQVIAQRNTIIHGKGQLVVVNACSGLELAAQLTVIAIIFILVFPLKSNLRKISAVLIAPVIALGVNCIRVALLTVIHGSGLPMREILFDLVHESWGGLAFAGVAVTLFGWLYLQWIEKELSPKSL